MINIYVQSYTQHIKMAYQPGQHPCPRPTMKTASVKPWNSCWIRAVAWIDWQLAKACGQICRMWLYCYGIMAYKLNHRTFYMIQLILKWLLLVVFGMWKQEYHVFTRLPLKHALRWLKISPVGMANIGQLTWLQPDKLSTCIDIVSYWSNQLAPS